MNNFDKKIFSLYPSCVLVNGKNKDALYDLQRQSYSLIPSCTLLYSDQVQ